MKKAAILVTGILFFFFQNALAQQITENENSSPIDKSIYFSAGLNFSLPVHIMMYRSHRLAVGVNARAFKKISPKTELGLKFDYDYRFIKSKSKKLITPESTLEERALHSNFSLFCLKPNIQFDLGSNWYLGAETGVGYVLSDADPHFGLGFVSEFAGPQQFGICSGLYLGKYLLVGPQKDKIGISMDLTQFLAHGHAENSLGLKFCYVFNKHHSS